MNPKLSKLITIFLDPNALPDELGAALDDLVAWKRIKRLPAFIAAFFEASDDSLWRAVATQLLVLRGELVSRGNLKL